MKTAQHALYVLAISVLLPSCAALDQSPAERPPAAQISAKPLEDAAKGLWNALSAVVNPRMGKMKSLLDEKKFVEADQFYEAEQNYFSTLKDEDEAKLAPLAAYLNEQLVPKLESAITELNRLTTAAANGAGPEIWPQEKTAFLASDELLKQYSSHTILQRPKFRAGALDRLGQMSAAFRATLIGAATDAFCTFEVFSAREFAEEYPVSVDLTSVVRTGFPKLKPRIIASAPPALRIFKENYGKHLDPAQSQELARIYLSQLLGQNGSSLLAKLGALKDAREAGFDSLSLHDLQIGLIEVKPTRTDAPQVNLAGVGADEVALVDRSGMVEVSGPTQRIVLDFSGSTIDRKVTSKTERPSRFVSGQRSVQNPDYDIALRRYQQVESDYQQYQANISNNPARGWGAVFQGFGSIAMGAARGKATQDLNATPQTTTEDVFEDYTFSVSTVSSRKLLRANILAIDTTARQFQRVTLKWEEAKEFELAFNTKEKDASWHGSYASEADIEAYEKAPVTLSATTVLKELLSSGNRPTNYATWENVVANLDPESPQREVPMPGTASAAADTTYRPTESGGRLPTSAVSSGIVSANQVDPRYESIVVIETPKGALGTGFFVADDLIITNQHVIEGAGFAEVRLSDGRKSFGKVVKSDLNLDLALLRVADRGKPVEFYNAQVVSGATVDVIGHPHGLSYSLSRGVVSAVRKMPNPFVKGGPLVTYIQTDAKINPGNSGGPMYLDGKVIGVNTQKMTGRASEGIGFAVHYAEVLRFLQDYD